MSINFILANKFELTRLLNWKSMKLTLKIWRQKNAQDKEQWLIIKSTELPDMSFLMLEV
jgi:hypothetical protein